MTKTVAVAGALAGKPWRGGHSWVILQYLLGFRRLGYQVLFLDQVDPKACVDGQGRPAALAESENLRSLQAVMRRFDLEGSYCLVSGKGEEFLGLNREETLKRVGRSLLLLNIMGFLRQEEILQAAPRRVFLDIDPGFGQFWRQLGQADIFSGHDDWVSIGENLGRPECPVPTCGLNWITTPQPVVLQEWPQARTAASSVSSVATWRGAYSPVEFEGRAYGLRVHEFRRFLDLPRRFPSPFELVLDIHPADQADIRSLGENGWNLLSPQTVATPDQYRAFVQQSWAEFQVAKNIYVETRCGWLSDRTLCYLASGRPAVVQDTGLNALHPTGKGLLLHSDPEEALQALEEVRRDYAFHSRAARRLAEERFDSDKVLGRLLENLGAR